MAKDEPLLIETLSHPRFQEMNQLPTNITGSSSSSSSSSLAFSLSDRLESLGGPIANGLTSCSLKRKRPLKIEIPNVLRELSADAFKGCTAQESVSFTDSGIGVFSQKGKKKFMEDAHKICSSSSGYKDFFGVYDGHGGSKAAEFVAENLHLKIFETLERNSEGKAKEEAVKAGYLNTDEEFLKQGWGSGTCCVTALIEGREMMVSNLGDCRAVLCRDGMAEALTTDHRPTREYERRRIEEQGGYVEMHRGTWRVHGTLAVSRSIGDAHLKDWVMAEPDTQIVRLTPDMQFLVLASDGLWEEVGNQEAVDIVVHSCSYGKKQLPVSCTGSPSPKLPRVLSLVKPRRVFRPAGHKTAATIQRISEDEVTCDEHGSPPSKTRRISQVKKMKTGRMSSSPSNENENEKPANGGLSAACKELVDLAVSRGSMDDITVMIVDLARYQG